MGLETGTYISALNASNPVTGDNKTEGDDHLRLIKSTLLATFPAVTGAVTPTHTELNYVDGVTSAIQTQLDAKLATAGGTQTGTITFSDAGEGVTFSLGSSVYDNALTMLYNAGATVTNQKWYFNSSEKMSLTSAGVLTVTGLIRGNGSGGNGLGTITVSTSAASGGAAGDIWLRYV